MAKIYCVANQKGGVGKTTTAVNLAAALSQMGFRVLLIDLDPQGNSTTGSGVEKTKLRPGVYEVLKEEANAQSAIQQGKGGYCVIGANRSLAIAEEELIECEDKENRLRKVLKPVEDQFDVIVIDCPPTLSILTLNAFCASHGLIIPVTCEFFSLEGVADLVETIKRVRRQSNRRLTVAGLLRVRFDPRITLQREVSDQLKAGFRDAVYGTVIPTNVRLAEAPGHGLPGILFDKSSKGAMAYKQFAEEFAEREKLFPGERTK